MKPENAYLNPNFARLYDSFINTTFDIPFFIKETGKTSGDVLELMSGTGRVSIPLIEAGVHLTCVDNSPEMLDKLQRKLKQRKLRAEIYQMDIRELNLNKHFDLIIIPFHSFSEILSLSDQQKVLTGIYKHLSSVGRFICTLHNPTVRPKSLHGQLRLVGKFPVKDGNNMLIVWIKETYHQEKHVIESTEIFEEYDMNGLMKSKNIVELSWHLLTKKNFKKLATQSKFKVKSLYGDYTYAEFQEKTSPFMIWVLGK